MSQCEIILMVKAHIVPRNGMLSLLEPSSSVISSNVLVGIPHIYHFNAVHIFQEIWCKE